MAVATIARPLGATALLGKGLTPGKLRGLQRISNPNGTLTMLALDQNSSMIEMAQKALKAKGQDREPTYEEIVEAKLDMMRQMAPAASGVLIDAYYGAWPAIASGAIPPDKGMLVRVEKSGSPKNKVGGPMGEIEPGWSVEKIKLMGADAVKLLAPFEPGEPVSAEHQFALIEQIYDDCKKYDILFLLEPVAFPYRRREEDRHELTSTARPRRSSSRPGRSAGSATSTRPSSPAPSATSPTTSSRDNLHALDAASERPWVLLSAGRRLPRLPQAGRDGDGVPAARASSAAGPSGRSTSSRTATRPAPSSPPPTGLKRVADVDDVVREHGTPWFARTA